MPDVDKETLKPSAIPPVVTEIQQIYQADASYQQALATWKAENLLREKTGLELRPEPDKPESSVKADFLNQDRSALSKAVGEALWDIENNEDPAKKSHGYTVTDEIKDEMAEKVRVGLTRMETFIEQMSNYNGTLPSDYVRVTRGAVLIERISDTLDLSKAEELLAKVIEKSPESLHFVRKYPSEVVSNCYHGLRTKDGNYGNKYKETILGALASESSPLTEQQREHARFYRDESVGYRIYTELSTLRDVKPIGIDIISEVLGVNITSEQWAKASKSEFKQVDQLPSILAKLSHDESLSPEYSKKLQAEVVGMIKAMEVTSNNMVTKSSNSWETTTLTTDGLFRKQAAAEAILNLIDRKNVGIYDITRGSDGSDPSLVNHEIRKMYENKALKMESGQVQQMFYDQNREVNDIRNRARQQQEKVEREQKAAAQAEKAKAEKAALDAVNQGLINKYESLEVKAVILRINPISGDTTPTTEALLALQRSGVMTVEEYQFVNDIARRIPTINDENIRETKYNTVVDNKGFLGFGKQTHLEPVRLYNHADIRRQIAERTAYLKAGEVPSRADAVTIKALEFFLTKPEN